MLMKLLRLQIDHYCKSSATVEIQRVLVTLHSQSIVYNEESLCLFLKDSALRKAAVAC